MPVRDTGSPRADAENDFLRARRHQVLSALAGWLRNDTHDVVQTLSFDEAVDALGRRGESYRGTQVIALDAIIGSVDRMRDFDRRFRPTSSKSRQRWERLARASRTGETIPPIDVYQLGDYYFVRDGHHRVSVARALNLDVIEANVTEVLTMLAPVEFSRREQLERKHWRRIFLERVPLSRTRRAHIEVTDPVHYGWLAEMVEAWGARLMHAEETYLDRPTVASRWYEEDFTPVLEMVEDAGVRGEDETEADAYMRVSGERYRLIREHEWNRDIMAQVTRRKRRPRRKQDDPTRL
jgi:hypothetical protein